MAETTAAAKELRPYGDGPDDPKVQLSFTLPAPPPIAAEAGRMLAAKMGLADPRVVFQKDLGEGFTFLIVYGNCTHAVDAATVRIDRAVDERMDREQIDAFIAERVGRKVVVVGACIESDAHTVGIDAILNMKGYHGDYGLERYGQFTVVNMGAQVKCEDLIRTARRASADALLVSQIVTQRNVHLHNLTRLVDLLEAEGLRDRLVLVVGGPSIDHAFAKELGYDAGFGRGTLPSDVATFIARRMGDRAGRGGRAT